MYTFLDICTMLLLKSFMHMVFMDYVLSVAKQTYAFETCRIPGENVHSTESKRIVVSRKDLQLCLSLRSMIGLAWP